MRDVMLKATISPPHAARARSRGWTVHQFEADHNPQWSAPEALVEMLGRGPVGK